ncbi:hypothetical protein H6A10_07260 [Enorma massiliensis]|uniref:ABC-three component system protein n=2 Tax=Enorma massiliensis TaxID=1472761 RepID=UPI00195AF051|nr:ABC-three component system protein [Enorma massiliensis]MBM6892892.1 hypothetical protein [Enorma massiliensis]
MEVKEAVGSYEGFSAEERLALLELLKTSDENVTVSIERDDDISVDCCGVLKVIQSKSSGSDGAVYLRNRSAEFWKTIARWVEKTHQRDYGDKTVNCYCYSISAPFFASERVKRFSSLFNDARGLAEAEGVLNRAIGVLGNSSASIKKYLDVVFSPKMRDSAKAVIDKLSIETHHDLNNEVMQLFKARAFTSHAHEEALYNDALGWLKGKLADQSQQGISPQICYIDFAEYIRSAAEQYQRDPLTETVGNPGLGEVEQVRESNPIFLRQLHAIQRGSMDQDEEDLQAICNWLRSSSQIVRWVKEDGLITQPVVNSYQNELVEAWRLECDDVISDSSGLSSPEQQGRKIYIKTQRESRRKDLAGSVPPTFVSDGQLHELADVEDIMTDKPRVIWNPLFVEQERSIGGAG